MTVSSSRFLLLNIINVDFQLAIITKTLKFYDIMNHSRQKAYRRMWKNFLLVTWTSVSNGILKQRIDTCELIKIYSNAFLFWYNFSSGNCYHTTIKWEDDKLCKLVLSLCLVHWGNISCSLSPCTGGLDRFILGKRPIWIPNGQ